VKNPFRHRQFPAAAKAGVDFAAFAARLEAAPFKT
jgi:hypothetical protein